MSAPRVPMYQTCYRCYDRGLPVCECATPPRRQRGAACAPVRQHGALQGLLDATVSKLRTERA